MSTAIVLLSIAGLLLLTEEPWRSPEDPHVDDRSPFLAAFRRRIAR